MKVRFWGVRGSIPTPGPLTIKYGGNTSCIEIRGDKDELLIMDAGTGLRELGNFLLDQNTNNKSLDIPIMLSHTHWDHIQGIPFFAPAFLPSTNITFRGPICAMGNSLGDIVAGQMSYSYFPIKLSEMRAKIQFVELREETFELGSFKISTCFLNHPVICLGYRFSYGDKSVVTIYDNEPYRNVFKGRNRANESMEKSMARLDSVFGALDAEAMHKAEQYVEKQTQKLYEFAYGADVLICDSQYTESEYVDKIGWGHGSIQSAMQIGLQSKVKRLIFFHHDPSRSDAELDALQSDLFHKISEMSNGTIMSFFARERLEVVF